MNFDVEVPEEEVVIYTDGACFGNPGPGGLGAILTYRHHTKSISDGYRLTTNNRMELLAAIRALETLKYPCANVVIVSDSTYLVDAFNKGWLIRWRDADWKRDGKPVPNCDLWKQLWELTGTHNVNFEWVRGHSGHPFNEKCDKLASEAAKMSPVLIDEKYEGWLRDAN